MEIEYTDFLTLLVSVLCGSLLGIEREYQNKSAGLRTIVLICLGSTVFTIVSQRMGGSDDRIASNIITGVGFIGAGVIFKGNYDVRGLTTAAVIWIAAAIGMVIGISEYKFGIILSLIVLVILSGFAKLEYLIDIINHHKTYRITFIDNDLKNITKITDLVRSEGLKQSIKQLSKAHNRLTITMDVSGNKKQFRHLTEKILAMTEVQEI